MAELWPQHGPRVRAAAGSWSTVTCLRVAVSIPDPPLIDPMWLFYVVAAGRIKAWSAHTVELIVTNRTYLGEKSFRDIVVADAHEAIITEKQFDLAQRILGKRSTEVGSRAANPSDYALTGKIRCPQCGRGYIGTAAKGRYKTYRYYTCWSRARYGTKAGCDVHRFNADEIEEAITTALLDFYTTRDDLISQALTTFQERHTAATGDLRAQLASVERELHEAAAATDRYLIAFERGALDDDDTQIRHRLARLEDQARQLRGRKAELQLQLDQPPQALSPADLAAISNAIREILTSQEPPNPQSPLRVPRPRDHRHRRRRGQTSLPSPPRRNDERPTLDGPALDGNQVVRALTTMVGDTGIEPVTSSV
ncbi:recombinase zinc beta ribbon domain-containing protein [Phytohabitans sp. LJ34]|uniref:recombinase family protein n=1 Tax=Phytohabitans sp. LJ34 TaxID=3452217 RepID=UPI003F8CAFF7